MQQSYCDFYLLIINDGSTDASTSLINTYTDKRIITIHQENRGVSYTRNEALKYCLQHNYDGVALLDGDDYWESNHLSTLVTLSQKFSSCEIFSSNYTIQRNKKLTPKYYGLSRDNEQVLKNFFVCNLWNSTLNCSNLLIKRTAIETVGFFNEQLTHYEDIDWFIRIGIHFRTAFSNTITVHIDQMAPGRSDAVDHSTRVLPDFIEYNGYKNLILGLGKYLDINRFSIALYYKMNGFTEKALRQQSNINLSNLSKKQRFLLSLNSVQLKAFYKLKKILQLLGLDLRTS